MKLKSNPFMLLLIILVFAVSCERSLDLSEPDYTGTSLEDRLEVSFEEAPTEDEVATFSNTPFHSIFCKLLEERGYHIWSDDAAHYKAIDPATGKIGHMTLIPCSIPGDESRIAMIKYFRSEDGYAVTAAEYHEYEDYQIPHPIDERAGLYLLDEDADPDLKHDLLDRSESSKRYWQCVTNRFVAGCSGCASVCWLAGPGWGPCTAKCCAGSMVVALISCAFTVYLGW